MASEVWQAVGSLGLLQKKNRGGASKSAVNPTCVRIKYGHAVMQITFSWLETPVAQIVAERDFI